MENQQALERLGRVKEVAALAGLEGEIDEQRALFQMAFLLPGERTQRVFVRDTSAKGRQVVTFFSPCGVAKKGLVSGLGKETAVGLLAANETLHFARYGIWQSAEDTTIVASCDCLLDTLDPDELRNAAWSVAYAADMFEHDHGRDEY